MPSALITGVTGQDGWYLAEYLQALDYRVFGLVRRSAQGREIPPGIEVIEGDVTAPPMLPEVAEVYNLAAMSHVGESFKSPRHTFEVNALGALNMLEHARKCGAAFYQASTSELFGTSPPPQAEGAPLHPRSPYGCAKLAAYWMAINYREAYGMRTFNGILFNHESPRRGGDFVTQKICRGLAGRVRGDGPVLKLGNIEAARDWGHAADYVRAMHLMVQHEPGEYVVATGQMHTVREWLDAAAEYAGLDWTLHVEHDPALLRPAEVPALRGDASKIMSLGWRPRYTFTELVAEMMDHALRPDHGAAGRTAA